jgi:hypothetical protein
MYNISTWNRLGFLSFPPLLCPPAPPGTSPPPASARARARAAAAVRHLAGPPARRAPPRRAARAPCAARQALAAVRRSVRRPRPYAAPPGPARPATRASRAPRQGTRLPCCGQRRRRRPLQTCATALNPWPATPHFPPLSSSSWARAAAPGAGAVAAAAAPPGCAGAGSGALAAAGAGDARPPAATAASPAPGARPPLPLRSGRCGQQGLVPLLGPSPPRAPPLSLLLWRVRFRLELPVRRILPLRSPLRWSSIRRLLHRPPTRFTPSPPSPLPVRNMRRDRPVCGKRPSCGSTSVRPLTLSLLKLPRRNSSSLRLRRPTAGPPLLPPWAACTEPSPAPPPRCSGMTRLTRSWLSSTFRLGVSRTFA